MIKRVELDAVFAHLEDLVIQSATWAPHRLLAELAKFKEQLAGADPEVAEPEPEPEKPVRTRRPTKTG